jgi:hypothetical protein
MGLHTGALAEGDEEHWYKFEVPHGHVLSLAFTPGEDVPGSLDVWLYNSDQKDIWSAQNVGPTVTQSGTRVMNTSSGGTYYVQVCDGPGSYSLDLSLQGQNDAGSGGDAGDELLQGLEVGTGQTISGQIGNYDEEDWYKFELPHGHILSLAFTPGEDVPGSLDIWLYNSDQKEIWSAQNVGPTVTQLGTRVMNTSSGGTYYVRVCDGEGRYGIELASQSQNDAGSGGDAGDELVQALEVGTGQTISGQLGDYDEEDWYKVEVPAGHILSLAFTPGEDVPHSLDVWLYNPDQKEIWAAQNVGPTVTKSYEMTEGMAGPHYIQVSDGQGSYALEIK